MMKVLVFSFIAPCFLFFNFARAANFSDVVINEIAWMGTKTSYNDEWIELKNNTDKEINLDGWTLKTADETPEIKLAGTVLANGLYLLERTDDNTVPGITADQIYTGALGNSSEKLELYDNLGNLIDSVDASSGWPAGDNITKQTMERNLSLPSANNWQTSQEPGGTPAAENSPSSPPIQKLAEDGPPPVSSEYGPSISSENDSENDSPTTAPPIIAGEPRGDSPPILAAISTAIFSGMIILILKRKLTY